LVIGSDEHRIVGVDTLTITTSAASFATRATVSASTKRYTSDGTTGKQSTSTPESSLSAWPLMTLDPRTADRFPEIASPATVKKTLVKDDDEIRRLFVEVVP